MTTKEIAGKLADYCRKGEWAQAQHELYAEDVVSIEPYATDNFEKETRGLKNIIAKGEKFNGMVEEIHSLEVGEPVIAGDSFAFVLRMDVTMKGTGRMNMPELCVYTVKDGKVVSEQFFV
ncbi:nuclear transport factor 2 family protein [Pseudoflavitalea sp. G-6-1-2]|uniref:nuclear transport factor 2 family protein n=1 Tax=Pseudoflavitalea sp. G-6-1-2 TaxID=2728841 RepID=UPI00146D58DB|nr:nuclear transport factor 2 family protein [Pseudoflavitalea sp. G-6-1-2]NML22993.1 nuclear transport factor 2 family protein [Pseudoflavitalea sp. G-6-1-2]